MPLFCPTDSDVSASAAALRPRGDAWRNGGHDGIAGSVMGQFFDGLGAAAGPSHRRLCDLVNEFFCSTAVETTDLWQIEHGLPDACGPFLDACAKAGAVGDSTAEYAIVAAAARGWAISIDEEWVTGVEDCTVGLGLCGTMICGASTGVKWKVAVDTANSPSFVATDLAEPLAGLMLAGDALNCEADIEPLKCLVRLIAPAHADLEFITIV